jgi:hypothetical protein
MSMRMGMEIEKPVCIIIIIAVVVYYHYYYYTLMEKETGRGTEMWRRTETGMGM